MQQRLPNLTENLTDRSLISCILLFGLVAGITWAAPPALADGLLIATFPAPAGDLAEIVTGSDGNLWFTHPTLDSIGQVTLDGRVTLFPVPTPGSRPFAVARGLDGNLWFTAPQAGKIGRITPTGDIVEFTVPGGAPSRIAAGPDGNLWFTMAGCTSRIGRITLNGVISEFEFAPGATPFCPEAIAAGPDGNVWFGGRGNRVGRITPVGVVTTFELPLSPIGLSSVSGVRDITTGPDGNVWFTGGVGPAGLITEFPLPVATTAPGGITAGPDGNLWFLGAALIGRASASNLLRLSPASGPYLSVQRLDIAVILMTQTPVDAARATLDARDVTPTLASCVVPGSLTLGGRSFRCPELAVGAIGFSGLHTLGVAVDLVGNGSGLSAAVTWEVIAATEP